MANIKRITLEAAMPNQSLPEPNSVESHELLEHITAFIGRYLQCSEHQRTILALWVLHTYALTGAQITPYLAIQSAEKQSGKTLCMQLLSMLCDSPAHTVGFTANSLTRRIDGPISTVLLDEFQATIGTRNRPKSPALRAVLSSGFNCGAGYTDAKHERNTFAPKAFAGMGQLPEALADRSISIILKPLNPREEKVQRFNLTQATKEAQGIKPFLQDWAIEHESELEPKSSYPEQGFPSNLSPRRCDMIEPLLRLADFIGGPWPARIRAALADAFQAETAFELQHSLQLLADIRDCFAWNNFPERLSTSTLIDWMLTRPARPWDAEGPITARAFARLLMPFEIQPRVQRIGSTERARGYQLEQFVELWQQHLGFTIPGPQPPGSPAWAGVAHDGVEVPSAALNFTKSQTSQITNKDAVCHAVTDSRAISVAAPQKPVVAAKSNPVTINQVEDVPSDLRVEPHTIPVGQNGVSAFS